MKRVCVVWFGTPALDDPMHVLVNNNLELNVQMYRMILNMKAHIFYLKKAQILSYSKFWKDF